MQLSLTPSLTFSAAAQLWLDSRSFNSSGSRRARFVAPKTIRDYEAYIRSLNRFFSDIPLNRIHVGHLVEYQRLRASGKLGPSEAELKKIGRLDLLGREVGPNKINQELGLLERIIKRAGAWSTQLEDCYEPFQREDSDIPRALSPEEQDRFLQVAAGRERWQVIHWYALLAFQTTCHNQELRNLKLGDLNLFDRLLQVRRDGAKNKYRIRTVPLTDEAFWAAGHLVNRARALGAIASHQYLFPFRVSRNCFDPNRPMTESGIKKLWEEVRCAAGVPWFRIHDTRHTAITRLSEAGAPISVVMSMAGHISPRMTQHYTQISEQSKRRALESAFMPKKQPSRLAVTSRRSWGT